MTGAPLLELQDVSVQYAGRGGVVSAVQDVSLRVEAGETFGLVGESGCGKTTLSMAVMGLLSPGAQVSGSIRFRGEDLTADGGATLRRVRGDRMSMVFQDPATSLDPTFPIGAQIAETLRAHQRLSRSQARRRAVELLGAVGIPDAASRYADPPHRLSGGMRQRVVIGAAVANEPDLLLADEPTTALDVTIQAQVLDLLRDLQTRMGMAVVLITHDLGVVAQVCDRVGVMYAGQLVEVAATEELFARPRHPYTRALLAAVPRSTTASTASGALHVVPGQVPDLSAAPPGCRFSDRCPSRMDVCSTVPGTRRAGRSDVACWLYPGGGREAAVTGASAVGGEGDRG